ncbi:Large-conductance mechanosensitive channel [Candidatus Protochlamydia naegleriophila]|uniref:Large-conductance mechanosensitive channel n=1 Tax=Candidatus Protochlamydia naegleriophila TaxID=389348 RepID=A0A0U5ES80_9BACT|nr:large-conductance mechanosensitive channel protein MscL [Candidatus Protochlamydia naegleriophila]CUI17056.1 Large-conductance mechanosensitive channel [Candidatus Protochlamydia naegleriophila]
MLAWLKEFKEFALRGNMVDLAVGIIIGAAFSKAVNSLVTDIVMPPIGLLLGGVDFSALSIKLNWPGSPGNPVEIRYGAFINTLIDLLILSGAIFLVIKMMNSLHKKQEVLPNTKECPECLMSIPLKAKKCGHCCSPITSENKI